MFSRRDLLVRSAAMAPLLLSGSALARTAAAVHLQVITKQTQPISPDERRARIAKVQALMTQQKIAALLIEPGSSLEYFTGIRWHGPEQSTLAIIPANGEVLVVTPAFEEPSVRESLQVPAEVRP